MAKEIYLYTGIYDYIAENLISKMEENMDSTLNMRVNTPGGNPLSMWGIAAKMKEHGNVNIQIDGAANSAGFFLLPYAKKVTALNVSSGLLHRADMYASTQVEKDWLNARNKDLRAQLESKINVAKLEKLKGVTMDQIFDPEKRIDVILTAKEMKAIGLVDEVIELTPLEVEAMGSMFEKIAASTQQQSQEDKNKKIMNIQDLRAQYPALYDEVFEIGAKAGVTAERDRVGAALVFNHLDPEGVKAIIASGKPMTATQQAEFALKAMSPKSQEELAAGAAKPTPTAQADDASKDKKNIELEAFAKSVRASLNLKEKAPDNGMQLGFERGQRAGVGQN